MQKMSSTNFKRLARTAKLLHNENVFATKDSHAILWECMVRWVVTFSKVRRAGRSAPIVEKNHMLALGNVLVVLNLQGNQIPSGLPKLQ